MIVTIVLSLVLIVLAIHFFRNEAKRTGSRSKGKTLPGPWGLPLVGYLPFIDPQQPHVSLTKLAGKYGDIYALKMGHLYTVVASNPKIIRRLLAMEETTGRAPLYLTHGVMQGYGLICAEGEMWREQRKFVSATLRNLGMIKFGPSRNEMQLRILHQVNACIQFISQKIHKIPTDPMEIFWNYIGNLMNGLMFSNSYADDDPIWLQLKHLQEEGVKHFGVAGPINFFPILKYVPIYKKALEFIITGMDQTHKLYQEIINRSNPCKNYRNVIQAFLYERQNLQGNPLEKFYCDKQFHHLLADLHGAGLHTTLSTICWFFLHMASKPDIQKRVHEELDNFDDPILLDQMDSLPFTVATIAEVQRITTVVPMGIPHGTHEDIEIDGFFIPKGSMIVPLQWAVHTSENYWKNPDDFTPERFLNDKGQFFQPDAFIPYQTGKRMCVGAELARMILFLFCANVLKAFSVKSEQEIDLVGIHGITLNHKKPQKLVFECR